MTLFPDLKHYVKVLFSIISLVKLIYKSLSWVKLRVLLIT